MEDIRIRCGAGSCRILVTERNIDPFSWMKYIVLSRKDWEIPHESILAHEKAHIAYGHSIEILLVDVLSALQWFNPAIWMLRADLKELHTRPMMPCSEAVPTSRSISICS